MVQRNCQRSAAQRDILKWPLGTPRWLAVGLRGGGRVLATAWIRDNELCELEDFSQTGMNQFSGLAGRVGSHPLDLSWENMTSLHDGRPNMYQGRNAYGRLQTVYWQ
jgi:hypothetical protein